MHVDSLTHHIGHLEDAHKKLNKEIDTLEKTGLYEDLKLEDLKKQRLHFKDEIARCRQRLAEMLK